MSMETERVPAPTARAEDAYDWITPEDVMRIALASFYRVCRDLDVPAAQPWIQDGVAWASREDVARDLEEDFGLRLAAFAHERGLAVSEDVAQELTRRDGARVAFACVKRA